MTPELQRDIASPPRRPRGHLVRALRVIAIGTVVAATGILAVIALIPLPPALLQPPAESLELTDRNGVLLRERLDEGNRYTRPITLEQIPQHLVLATLAAEDKRFFHHPGIDPFAIARAAFGAARSGRIVSGGSTITQQLVKITSGTGDRRTPWIKLVETIKAIKTDALWPKKRVLEAYLNRLDYGNLRIGCAAAARFYFDKPIADLSIAEAAQLAALPRSPSRLNPLRDPSAAREAQEIVLERMLHNGWLSQRQYLHALGEPIDPGARRIAFRAPHFADLALANANGRSGRTATTLDLSLNRFVEEKLRSRLAGLGHKRVSNGGAVIIDNRTGEVLSLVGSENYFRPGAGQVNAATARRSPGSALKPFTYLLAIQRGYTAASLLADVPSEFPTPTGMFRPVNFDRSFRGPVRLRAALANSLNVPAVRLLAAIGGPTALADALKSCGLTTLEHDADYYGLGLTIGNAEVRLLELANAYACLARLGIYRPCRIFRDDADSPKAHAPVDHRVFEADSAWLIANILNDDFARSPSFGPRSSLSIGFPVACKTGTSSDFRDNWAFGFTPEFTVGIWIGNFDGSPMQGVSGATGAAPLLRDIFRYLRQSRGTTWYATPAHIVTMNIHPVTGKRMPRPAGGIAEHFIARHLPPPESPSDYDSRGMIILGDEYTAWLRDARPQGFALSSDARNRLSIDSPHDGAVYYLDPDLPGSDRLPLRAAGSGTISWHSDTLPIESQDGVSLARLSVGRHQIMAEDSASGKRTRLSIEVRGM
ncbi:MAG TPA: penicillin-binding protein 1C [Verrucomicrobiae bacterium]|nr:penicillin-binding protein 1C [Verrucomicrobiae bacterium]